MSDVLIIGVGNAMRSDDALGPLALQEIQKRLGSGFDYACCNGEGAELMDVWSAYDKVLVIDAVQAGGSPASIYTLEASAQKIPSRFFNYSSHAFGLAEAVELSRALSTLPAQLVIVGMEGKEFGHGFELSAPLQGAFTGFIDVLEKWALILRDKGVYHA